MRSYGDDVTRLCDVCRQSIVFTSPAALLRCLRLLLADPEVRVLRIKNRLARTHRARETAGYRDVQVRPPSRRSSALVVVIVAGNQVARIQM